MSAVINIRENLVLPKPTDLSGEDNIVAAYNMIRSGDKLIDISGNGYDYDILGAVQHNDGLYLTGSRRGLDSNALVGFDPDSGFTIAARVMLNKFGVRHGIVGRGSTAIYVRVDAATQKVQYQVYDGSTILGGYGAHTIQLRVPFDVVFTFDGAGTVNGYLNGVLDEAETDLAFNTIAGGTFTIGDRSGSDFWDGVIFDVRFYSTPWTETEVKAYHNSWAKPERYNIFGSYF